MMSVDSGAEARSLDIMDLVIEDIRREAGRFAGVVEGFENGFEGYIPRSVYRSYTEIITELSEAVEQFKAERLEQHFVDAQAWHKEACSEALDLVRLGRSLIKLMDQVAHNDELSAVCDRLKIIVKNDLRRGPRSERKDKHQSVLDTAFTVRKYEGVRVHNQ